jgi:hypothetical protein
MKVVIAAGFAIMIWLGGLAVTGFVVWMIWKTFEKFVLKT